MRNLDAIKATRETILQNMRNAITAGDQEAFAQSFEQLSDNIQERVMAQVEQQAAAADAGVLAARGVNVLTSQERSYYDKLIEAMKSNNPKQALAGAEVTMPTTIVDRVFEDLRSEYPLLDVIDFENTSGLAEVVINASGRPAAAWGALTATIVNELTAGLMTLPNNLVKLSAFLPIAKAYLDLGASYLDQYVRTLLTESIYAGLEAGIVTGTGKDMPIGMDRDVADDVTVTGGVYPQKTAESVTEITPESYGKLAAKLATVTHKIGETTVTRQRPITGLVLVCNPVDYLSKIMPGTTVIGAGGALVHDLFPIPTKVIQSSAVPSGEAILGLPNRYFMGLGTTKSGKIEYSDDYRFCEDERVYIAKLYGMGRPKDNAAFLRLDISGLTPAAIRVITEAAG